MADAVDAQSGEVAKMALEWPMLEALMAGTRAMRDQGETLLPKWPAEEDKSYATRKGTATLFPALQRTVSVMAGKPFAKPLTHSDDTPPQIIEWADDIDREGVNLNTFAAEMLAEAMAYGFCGILVEAPKAIAPAGKVPTVAEEKAAGVRPYFVRVRHNQVLGWRVQRINGKATLTQLRLKEDAVEPDGLYGEKTVERVRVLTPGAWEVWEKVEGKGGAAAEWVSIEQGQSGLSVVPFVPIYGRKLGYMVGAPPLLALANMNVEHWQSKSDQQTILHVARVPILAISGGDENTAITVGAASAVKLPMGAELKFVEHTGKAIEAGAKSLTDLEDQMIQAGAELLVKKPGARTATESANDAEGNKSDLQRIAEGYSDSLDQALQLMADYAKLGTGGEVTLFSDYGAATLSDASSQLVLSLQQGGLITKSTAINELKRRGVLADTVDAEVEAEGVAEEGPALGTIDDKAA